MRRIIKAITRTETKPVPPTVKKPESRGAEVLAKLEQMYAEPPRPSLSELLRRMMTLRIIDYAAAILLWLLFLLTVGDRGGSGHPLTTAEALGWGLPGTWLFYRAVWGYSKSQQRIKELEGTVEHLEYQKRWALKEIDDLKKQLREHGQPTGE